VNHAAIAFVARHAPQTGTEFGFDHVEVVGAEVGQFPSLDVRSGAYPGKRSTTSQCR
jgi:hypothetical protein